MSAVNLLGGTYELELQSTTSTLRNYKRQNKGEKCSKILPAEGGLTLMLEFCDKILPPSEQGFDKILTEKIDLSNL